MTVRKRVAVNAKRHVVGTFCDPLEEYTVTETGDEDLYDIRDGAQLERRVGSFTMDGSDDWTPLYSGKPPRWKRAMVAAAIASVRKACGDE